MTHYRSPANFSFEALTAAKQALFRLKRYIYEEYQNKAGKPDTNYLDRFTTIINNDLDTPRAIALLHDITKDTTLDNATKCVTLKKCDEVLGIGLTDEPDTALRKLGIVASEDLTPEIQALIDERELARSARNWPESDRLRELLNLKGYSIEDTPHGPKVSKV